MATNYLNQNELEKDIDRNSVAALTAIAAGGQEGLNAYREAEDRAAEINAVAEKDYGEMLTTSDGPDALLAEMMLDRETVLSGVNTARDISEAGFQTGVSNIQSAIENYGATLKSQAPVYEEIGQTILTDAANRRAAAAEQARQTRLKDARSTFFRSLQNEQDFRSDTFDVYRDTVANTQAAIGTLRASEDIKTILRDLTRPDNPESMSWFASAVIGNTPELRMYASMGAEAIAAYLAINYPTVDPSSVLSYLTLLGGESDISDNVMTQEEALREFLRSP